MIMDMTGNTIKKKYRTPKSVTILISTHSVMSLSTPYYGDDDGSGSAE